VDGTAYFVHQELRRAGVAANSAQMQVARAKTLAEVQHFGRITLHPLIRPLRSTIPEIRQLRQAQVERSRVLVDAQLAQMRKMLADAALAPAERLAKAKAMYGRWQQQEWPHLRGEQAQVLQYVQREAQMMLGKAEQAARSA
jgi:hypothetical protein